MMDRSKLEICLPNKTSVLPRIESPKNIPTQKLNPPWLTLALQCTLALTYDRALMVRILNRGCYRCLVLTRVRGLSSCRRVGHAKCIEELVYQLCLSMAPLGMREARSELALRTFADRMQPWNRTSSHAGRCRVVVGMRSRTFQQWHLQRSVWEAGVFISDPC